MLISKCILAELLNLDTQSNRRIRDILKGSTHEAYLKGSILRKAIV